MNMVVYTLEQRCEILRDYFENHGNAAECVPKLHTDFGRREAPSALYVRYLVKKVKETDILIDSPSSSTKEHFIDISEKNFTLRLWYDAIQSPIDSGVEAINHIMRFRYAKWDLYMPILAEKKSSFQVKLILILAGM